MATRFATNSFVGERRPCSTVDTTSLMRSYRRGKRCISCYNRPTPFECCILEANLYFQAAMLDNTKEFLVHQVHAVKTGLLQAANLTFHQQLEADFRDEQRRPRALKETRLAPRIPKIPLHCELRSESPTLKGRPWGPFDREPNRRSRERCSKFAPLHTAPTSQCSWMYPRWSRCTRLRSGF